MSSSIAAAMKTFSSTELGTWPCSAVCFHLRSGEWKRRRRGREMVILFWRLIDISKSFWSACWSPDYRPVVGVGVVLVGAELHEAEREQGVRGACVDQSELSTVSHPPITAHRAWRRATARASSRSAARRCSRRCRGGGRRCSRPGTTPRRAPSSAANQR